MLGRFLKKFLVRWVASALGLWIASAILGSGHLSFGGGWETVVIAGLVLALVNMALKPILVVLSIPAIILSLGLFMLAVNGVLILLAHWLYNPLYVENFGWAVLAGLVVSIVNLLVTKVLEDI